MTTVHVARKKRCHRHHALARKCSVLCESKKSTREKLVFTARPYSLKSQHASPGYSPDTLHLPVLLHDQSRRLHFPPSALLGSLEHASNELAETSIVGFSGALRKINKEVLASFAGKHRDCSARGSGSRLVDLQVSLCFCFGGWKVVWASPGRLAGPALGQF
jgi:hypothetical protein